MTMFKIQRAPEHLCDSLHRRGRGGAVGDLLGLPDGARHVLDGQPERGEERREHGGRLRGELLAREREPGVAAAGAAHELVQTPGERFS